MKAPRERDHYTEHPARWVAACCDRGVRHHRNEDATAIAAEPEPGSRAVLVVCDGVSTSLDSDVASLAGARAARDLLVAQQPAGLGTPASGKAAVAQAIERAAAAANAAVIANTAPESRERGVLHFLRRRAGRGPDHLRQHRRQPDLLDPRPRQPGRARAAECGRLRGPGPDRDGRAAR